MGRKVTDDEIHEARKYEYAIAWVKEMVKKGKIAIRKGDYQAGTDVRDTHIVAEVNEHSNKNYQLSTNQISKIRGLARFDRKTEKEYHSPLSISTLEKHLHHLEYTFNFEIVENENGEFECIPKKGVSTEMPIQHISYYEYFYLDDMHKVSKGMLKVYDENAELKIMGNHSYTTLLGDVRYSEDTDQFSIHFQRKSLNEDKIRIASFCSFDEEDDNGIRFGVFASSGKTSAGKVILQKTSSEKWSEEIDTDIPDWVYLHIQQARLDYRGRKSSQPFSSKTVEYTAFRYSNTHNNVKEFSLTIDFGRGLYTCEEGFYGAFSNSTGFGEYINEGIFALLENSSVGYLFFNIYTGGLNLKVGTVPENPILPGMYQGVSSQRHDRIAGEMLLVRKDHLSKEGVKQYIQRYFNWQKKHIRVEGQSYNSPNELISTENRKPSEIRHLVGTYRAWSYNRSGEIIQSRFEIKDNYEAYLYSLIAKDESDGNLDGKQMCKFRMSKYHHANCLCVATYEMGGDSLVNFAIIEIPPKTVRRPAYLCAAYCNVGIKVPHADNRVFSGFIVFLEEKEGIDIPIGKLSDQEFESLLQQEKYQLLKAHLDKLVRENIYKD